MTISNGKTRTRLAPSQRKEQLLNFALDVFSKRDIGRAGHADIAEMADVSVATVFNYFPSREELVEAVLKQTEKEFKQLVNRYLAGNPDLSVALIDLSEAIIDAALDEKDWLKIWFEWSTATQEDIWQPYIEAKENIFSPYRDLFASTISEQEKRSADDIQRLFDGICYVLYLQTHQHPDKDILLQQAHRYVHIICR